MKHFLLKIFLLNPLFVLSQNYSFQILESLNLNDSTLYLVGRGTKSKSKIIADSFNIKNKNITHIGIGIYKNKKLKIYNVIDVQSSYKNALQVDSLESFINNSNVFSFSIWKCTTSKPEFIKVEHVLDSFSLEKVYFDYKFNIQNDNVLYCSEFCSKVLSSINSNYIFPPRVVNINDKFISLYLKRSSLEYFPVDFFIENNNIQLIKEFIFK